MYSAKQLEIFEPMLLTLKILLPLRFGCKKEYIVFLRKNGTMSHTKRGTESKCTVKKTCAYFLLTQYVEEKLLCLREAAKWSSVLVARPLRGGGVRAWPLRIEKVIFQKKSLRSYGLSGRATRNNFIFFTASLRKMETYT